MKLICVLVNWFVFWKTGLCFKKLFCVLVNWFVFWEIDLCFGKLICVLGNWFVFWETVLCFGKLICVWPNYFTPDSSQSVARKDNCLYFKLPYIRPFSIITQCRIKKLVNTLCSDLEIKLVFTPFKIKSWFGVKDPIPAGLRSRVIYKFWWAGCSACYIGETNRHFTTRIREHLASNKHSHISKHLKGSENRRSLCSEDCFKILDSASTSFQLKINEAMHILWEQPSLNSQVKHLNLSLSY